MLTNAGHKFSHDISDFAAMYLIICVVLYFGQLSHCDENIQVYLD